MPEQVATGVDFQPLPDGYILVEFQADDGQTLNEQVITDDVLKSIPVLAFLTEIAMREGAEAAMKVMRMLRGV